MIRAVLIDFGETLVERVVDDVVPLTELTIRPFEDARPALEQLAAAGHRLGLVSNTTQTTARQMRTVLAGMDLERFFDVVLTSFDVGREKPDPAMFALALARLDRAAEQAAMVGNDIVSDVGGAAALGMTTVWLARDRAAVPATAVAPTFTVASLSEVPALLGVV
jgi:HAD superfamily hydrolase (TIGR01662 family)